MNSVQSSPKNGVALDGVEKRDRLCATTASSMARKAVAGTVTSQPAPRGCGSVQRRPVERVLEILEQRADELFGDEFAPVLQRRRADPRASPGGVVAGRARQTRLPAVERLDGPDEERADRRCRRRSGK